MWLYSAIACLNVCFEVSSIMYLFQIDSLFHMMGDSIVDMSRDSNESFSSDDFDSGETYDMAPKDIFGEIGNEKVLIASVGDELPKDTRYKSTQQSSYAIKFRYYGF